VGDRRDCECASSSSLTSFGGITDDKVAFLRVMGLFIGDWAIFLLDCFLVLRAGFVLLFVASPSISTSGSTGEEVAAELVAVCRPFWTWPSRAGEERGLKYAPGFTVKGWGMLN
jgi:hypothetical protein